MTTKRALKRGIVDALRGLMLSDHLGDVHEELFNLCDLVGIKRFEGDYIDGWTGEDYKSVRCEDND